MATNKMIFTFLDLTIFNLSNNIQIYFTSDNVAFVTFLHTKVLGEEGIGLFRR